MHDFLYGLLTATGAIFTAQTLFNYTLNVQYFVGLFKKTETTVITDVKKDVNKL